jgi:hypothetical protein
MSYFDRELDITRNIRLIEWLKSELLTDISNLFKVLVNGIKEDMQTSVSETLANVVLISYLLGRRLGLSYSAIEIKIENKIRLGILEDHDVEKYYGDLSELAKHLECSRQRNVQYNDEF